MRNNRTILIAIGMFASFAAGCGGSEFTANNANRSIANANTNTAANSANSAVAVATPTPEQTTNNAPTLTPVYKAYCEAMVKKDEAALRKVMSSDTLKVWEEQMKEEKLPNLMALLKDEETDINVCEVRNERINGDQAIGRIIAAWAPNGVDVIFVKENGQWKLTTRFPTADAVKKAGGQ